jgi:hypothetical protein
LVSILVFVVALATVNAAFVDVTAQTGRTRTLRGSGEVASQERNLDSFQRIESFIGADIIVNIDSTQSVVVLTDDNIVDLIETDVHSRTLMIQSSASWSTQEGCEIRITVPKLEEITSYGSGYIEVNDLNSELFALHISGSADFWADGRVGELEIEINGSGDVDTRDLQAKEVYIRISGSGDAEVMALESFHGSISGSGDISYYGNPENVSRRVSGSGRIRGK